jgi:hypothetical protein
MKRVEERDVDRVLKFLHQAGAKGITQWDMHQPPDHGKPVERLAARVLDLKKKEGEDVRKFTEKRAKSRVARYVHADYVDAPAVVTEPTGQMALVEKEAA